MDASFKYVFLSGRSSVVEHNLAKVGVVGSNLIARSIFSYEKYIQQNFILNAPAYPDENRDL